MHAMIIITLTGLHIGGLFGHLTSPRGLNKSNRHADQIRRQSEMLVKSAPGTHNIILTKASIILITN